MWHSIYIKNTFNQYLIFALKNECFYLIHSLEYNKTFALLIFKQIVIMKISSFSARILSILKYHKKILTYNQKFYNVNIYKITFHTRQMKSYIAIHLIKSIFQINVTWSLIIIECLIQIFRLELVRSPY